MTECQEAVKIAEGGRGCGDRQTPHDDGSSWKVVQSCYLWREWAKDGMLICITKLASVLETFGATQTS